jgi:hypothetical protein
MAKIPEQDLAGGKSLEQIFESKKAARKRRADLPIEEKLKIVERLRDASRLIKKAKAIPSKKA